LSPAVLVVVLLERVAVAVQAVCVAQLQAQAVQAV
jgi:hypothetical protein